MASGAGSPAASAAGRRWTILLKSRSCPHRGCGAYRWLFGGPAACSFHIPPEHSSALYLFDSAIDLLSYATLRKVHGLDWKKDHLLSLAGVYQPKKEMEKSAVPLALTQYLADHPEIQYILLRLDNDYAGRMAAKALMTVLPENYTVDARFPPQGKRHIVLYVKKGVWQVPSVEKIIDKMKRQPNGIRPEEAEKVLEAKPFKESVCSGYP